MFQIVRNTMPENLVDVSTLDFHIALAHDHLHLRGSLSVSLVRDPASLAKMLV